MAVLTYFLVGIRPIPVIVELGTPQVVRTTFPQLGVHTRLTDEVEAWKIRRTAEMVRQMGAVWMVELFAWAHIEPRQGEFDWTHSDWVVAHARQQGLTIVARLGLAPAWARPVGSADNYLDPVQFPAFAHFARVFAQRYRTEIQHIIIWNEPNLAFEWGFRPIVPADYVELLRLTAPAIKKVNAQAIILGGALAPTIEPPGSPVGYDDLLYLHELLRLGAASWLDGLAVHVYGFTSPPDDPPNKKKLNWRRVELYRPILAQFGVALPIYITESGYNRDQQWEHGVTTNRWMQYTTDALEYSRHNWPEMVMIALWQFRTPAPSQTYMDGFSLIHPSFTPTPLYWQLQGRYDASVKGLP